MLRDASREIPLNFKKKWVSQELCRGDNNRIFLNKGDISFVSIQKSERVQEIWRKGHWLKGESSESCDLFWKRCG